MQFNLEIEDRDIDGFTEDAVKQLRIEIENHSQTIIKEAILLEEGLREGEVAKEITATYVKTVSKTNKVARLKKPSKLLITLKIISPISLTVVGFFFEYPFSSLYRFIFFIAFLLIGAISTVIENMMEK